MVISKPIAIFMLVVNIAFVTCSGAFLLYTKQGLFDTFSQRQIHIQAPYYNILLATFGILNFLIFIGLYLVLRLYKVKRWIRLGVVISCSWRIIVMVFGITLYYNPAILYTVESSAVVMSMIAKLTMGYMLVAFLFVHDKAIRSYFRVFSAFMLLTYLIEALCSQLYDEFGYSWLLINTGYIELIQYLVSLILFIELYNSSSKLHNRNSDCHRNFIHD